MKKFEISYYGWIPLYGDFDGDEIEIEAESEADAWNEFNTRVKFVKSAYCKEILN